MLCFHQPAKPGWLFPQAFLPKKGAQIRRLRPAAPRIKFSGSLAQKKTSTTYTDIHIVRSPAKFWWKGHVSIPLCGSISLHLRPITIYRPLTVNPKQWPKRQCDAACGGAGRGTLPRAMVNFKSCLSRHSCETWVNQPCLKITQTRLHLVGNRKRPRELPENIWSNCMGQFCSFWLWLLTLVFGFGSSNSSSIIVIYCLYQSILLLMEEILHRLKYNFSVNNGINYQSTGAGFLSSTVYHYWY